MTKNNQHIGISDGASRASITSATGLREPQSPSSYSRVPSQLTNNHLE